MIVSMVAIIILMVYCILNPKKSEENVGRNAQVDDLKKLILIQQDIYFKVKNNLLRNGRI